MERLKESEEVEGVGEVTYTGKGKDYVVLPSGENKEGSQEGTKRRKKLLFFAGLCFVTLIVVIIVLCVIFLRNKAIENPLPDISTRLTCTLAGTVPSQDYCLSKGCQYFELSKFSDKPRCVYPEINTFHVSSKTKLPGGGLGLSLQWRDENNPKDHHGIVYVRITGVQGSSVRIHMSASPAAQDDTLPVDKTSSPLNISCSGVGEPFSFSITRYDTGEVVYDTSKLNMVFTSGLVEISGQINTDKIHNDGTWLKVEDEPTIAVWHTPENLKLPYFYWKSSKGGYVGMVMYNTYPMKIEFGKRSDDSNVVMFSMLGGDVDLRIFAGSTLADITGQFIRSFGGAYRPPYWSLGSLAVNNIDAPLKASEYPLDTIIHLKSPVIHDTQNVKHFIRRVDPTRGKMDIEGEDPLVTKPDGRIFLGKLHPDSESGSTDESAPYIDYSADLSQFHYVEGSIYMANYSGYYLVSNFPTNYKDDTCETNDVNNPPYFKLMGDKELYSGTLCLDFVQEEGTHIKIHNIYGHLQAKVLSEMARDRDEDILQFSESIFIGSGAYTAKTHTVSCWKTLQQTISKSIWYGKLGINVVTILDKEVTDKDLILKYHRLIPYLPFTTAEEHALRAAENPFSDILEYTFTKYELYPEWLSALYHMEQDNQPLVRCASYNFPTDTFMASPEYNTNFHQYMVGDKILVAPVVAKINQIKVYLPQSVVWYQHEIQADGQVSFSEVSPDTNNQLQIENPNPEQYYFIRGGNILVTLLRFKTSDLKSNQDFIEQCKTRELIIHVLTGSNNNEEIKGKYLLTSDREVVMDVKFRRNSAADHVILSVESDSNKNVKWRSLIIYGIKREVDIITANGLDLFSTQFLKNPSLDMLTIYMESEPLDKSYHVIITYIN